MADMNGSHNGFADFEHEETKLAGPILPSDQVIALANALAELRRMQGDIARVDSAITSLREDVTRVDRAVVQLSTDIRGVRTTISQIEKPVQHIRNYLADLGAKLDPGSNGAAR